MSASGNPQGAIDAETKKSVAQQRADAQAADLQKAKDLANQQQAQRDQLAKDNAARLKGTQADYGNTAAGRLYNRASNDPKAYANALRTAESTGIDISNAAKEEQANIVDAALAGKDLPITANTPTVLGSPAEQAQRLLKTQQNYLNSPEGQAYQQADALSRQQAQQAQLAKAQQTASSYYDVAKAQPSQPKQSPTNPYTPGTGDYYKWQFSQSRKSQQDNSNTDIKVFQAPTKQNFNPLSPIIDPSSGQVIDYAVASGYNGTIEKKPSDNGGTEYYYHGTPQEYTDYFGETKTYSIPTAILPTLGFEALKQQGPGEVTQNALNQKIVDLANSGQYSLPTPPSEVAKNVSRGYSAFKANQIVQAANNPNGPEVSAFSLNSTDVGNLVQSGNKLSDVIAVKNLNTDIINYNAQKAQLDKINAQARAGYVENIASLQAKANSLGYNLKVTKRDNSGRPSEFDYVAKKNATQYQELQYDTLSGHKGDLVPISKTDSQGNITPLYPNVKPEPASYVVGGQKSVAEIIGDQFGLGPQAREVSAGVKSDLDNIFGMFSGKKSTTYTYQGDLTQALLGGKAKIVNGPHGRLTPTGQPGGLQRVAENVQQNPLRATGEIIGEAGFALGSGEAIGQTAKVVVKAAPAVKAIAKGEAEIDITGPKVKRVGGTNPARVEFGGEEPVDRVSFSDRISQSLADIKKNANQVISLRGSPFEFTPPSAKLVRIKPEKYGYEGPTINPTGEASTGATSASVSTKPATSPSGFSFSTSANIKPTEVAPSSTTTDILREMQKDTASAAEAFNDPLINGQKGPPSNAKIPNAPQGKGNGFGNGNGNPNRPPNTGNKPSVRPSQGLGSEVPGIVHTITKASGKARNSLIGTLRGFGKNADNGVVRQYELGTRQKISETLQGVDKKKGVLERLRDGGSAPTPPSEMYGSTIPRVTKQRPINEDRFTQENINREVTKDTGASQGSPVETTSKGRVRQSIFETRKIQGPKQERSSLADHIQSTYFKVKNASSNASKAKLRKEAEDRARNNDFRIASSEARATQVLLKPPKDVTSGTPIKVKPNRSQPPQTVSLLPNEVRVNSPTYPTSTQTKRKNPQPEQQFFPTPPGYTGPSQKGESKQSNVFVPISEKINSQHPTSPPFKGPTLFDVTPTKFGNKGKPSDYKTVSLVPTIPVTGFRIGPGQNTFRVNTPAQGEGLQFKPVEDLGNFFRTTPEVIPKVTPRETPTPPPNILTRIPGLNLPKGGGGGGGFSFGGGSSEGDTGVRKLSVTNPFIKGFDIKGDDELSKLANLGIGGKKSKGKKSKGFTI